MYLLLLFNVLIYMQNKEKLESIHEQELWNNMQWKIETFYWKEIWELLNVFNEEQCESVKIESVWIYPKKYKKVDVKNIIWFMPYESYSKNNFWCISEYIIKIDGFEHNISTEYPCILKWAYTSKNYIYLIVHHNYDKKFIKIDKKLFENQNTYIWIHSKKVWYRNVWWMKIIEHHDRIIISINEKSSKDIIIKTKR